MNIFICSRDNQSRRKSRSTNNYSYHLYLNPIRIAFGFISLLLIVLCVLSGLFYGVDLFLQSSCHLVHYDQSFLVSFATGNEKLIKIKEKIYFSLK